MLNTLRPRTIFRSYPGEMSIALHYREFHRAPVAGSSLRFDKQRTEGRNWERGKEHIGKRKSLSAGIRNPSDRLLEDGG